MKAWIHNNRLLIYIAFGGVLVLSSMLYLLVGDFNLEWTNIGKLFSHLFSSEEIPNELKSEYYVFFNLRMPRVLMVLIVGGALAVHGAALQSIFRNPLVDTSLIGVSSGAALGTVIAVLFFSNSSWSILVFPIFAFLGALIATTAVYRIAYKKEGTSTSLLVLAGIAVNAFIGAIIGWVIFCLDDDQLRSFTFWTLGSFSSGLKMYEVLLALGLIILPTYYVFSKSTELNIISLGENEAKSMGVNVKSIKRNTIYMSSIAIGYAVSLTGMIGFVGLVVPHAIRLFTGADNRQLFPLAIFLGAFLMLFSDLLARVIIESLELPVGIITASIGTPLFIFLIFKNK